AGWALHLPRAGFASGVVGPAGEVTSLGRWPRDERGRHARRHAEAAGRGSGVCPGATVLGPGLGMQTETEAAGAARPGTGPGRWPGYTGPGRTAGWCAGRC